MAVLPIRVVPDPVLRKKAKRVPAIGKSVRTLVTDMLETLSGAGGVGLAAPQVGVSLRVICIVLPETRETVVLVNPEVVRRKGERTVDEGCLSLPGYRGELKRSVSIVVKGFDAQGKQVRIRADELLAHALEHEIDHLDGVLFIDRLESQDKLYKIEKSEEPPDKVPAGQA